MLDFGFELKKAIRAAQGQFEVTIVDTAQLDPAQNLIQTLTRLATAGIITPEMEYIAIRENMGRAKIAEMSKDIVRNDLNKQHAGSSQLGKSPYTPGIFGRFPQRIPAQITPEFVRSEVAAGRAELEASGGITLANVLGVPIGTFIGQAFGWRATFVAVALIVSAP